MKMQTTGGLHRRKMRPYGQTTSDLEIDRINRCGHNLDLHFIGFLDSLCNFAQAGILNPAMRANHHGRHGRAH